ncbi:NFACT RNA binding domain-containing protein [Ureibacillus sp. FSL K6-8385]|uniref:Rqc2 homolog RqcH n=1 Tax=Ureibacillus terrenus TaxID=118246 RepID=A0A540V497_9BACL|nr:NFACT RNA binding domain-containing protein [Ureibacillus terrenus]MED3660344.1 NFACT RNA binding domain-containing protein [Ureibacillus terrenus]MED3762500.1 NFACT RNA binding domain-containing protein [Ureibacillus terrenus]TQE91567.1 fibronectin/fibrinogen-binding protein [Ureibacillus terrenus]
MAFDGLFTVAIINELKKLETGRISKVHQPNAMEVVLQIRAKGKTEKLLFSIHPSYARVHITKEAIENPQEPPMFCMLLRKHIEGGIITRIENDSFERVITFHIESKNEIGDLVGRKLIIEIMGKHSNLILVDGETNKIIDGLKHLPPSVNSYRTVLPGVEYIHPPVQNKVNPETVPDEVVEAFFSSEKTPREVVAHFAGFSPFHAKELLHRMKEGQKLEAYRSFIKEVTTGANPTYLEAEGKPYFSSAAITHLTGKTVHFEDLSSLLDRVFYARAERDRVKQQAGDLERFLHNEINKLKTKLKKLHKDLDEASKRDQYQLYGELLMANLYQLRKGMKEVTVTNYYNNEEMTIPLDERKTPIENAQSYYTKYNKAKNALIRVNEQIEKTNEEIEYFEMLLNQVQQASPADIEEIREELAEQGYLKKRNKKQKNHKQTKPSPETFISSTGIPISVGKNNKQNDYLTFKLAKKSDIWLHTKNIPGSHVVIHSGNPDDTTLKEAAILSAYFSKARNSSSVPVDYTQIRHVKKPNGAKPGFVIYFEQKTLYVTPDEEVVLKLKKKE